MDNSVINLILFATLSGLSIRISLGIAKQKWASTYHHTLTYVLLPLITMVITKIISGNIALSLGMVGALSIVRFRNPVKNSLELVVYFGLITIGIALTINVTIGLGLVLIMNLVIISFYLFDNFLRKYNFHLFSSSFDEASSNYIIEIESESAIDELHNSNYIVQYIKDKKSNKFLYRLNFKFRKEQEELISKLETIDSISSINARYSN